MGEVTKLPRRGGPMTTVDTMLADIGDMTPDDPDDPQAIIIRLDALQAKLEEYVEPLEAEVQRLRDGLEQATFLLREAQGQLHRYEDMLPQCP